MLVVLLAAIPFALLGHALGPGRVLAPVDVLMTAYPWRALAPNVVPANPLLTDVTYLVHPLMLWGAREIGEGRLPLWNPHVFAGAPYLANPHTAVFFPLTWLVWLLPAAPALTLHAIAKIVMVGLAMYWCGRVLGLARGAAFLGAIAFMLSGPVVVWLHWPYATTMAFLPLMVGLVERLRDRPDLRPVALLAIAVALDLFAGYPQGALWSFLTAGAWALARARGAEGGAMRFLGRFTAGVTLGGVAAAVQLLPFLEYARESAVVAYREQWMPYLALPGRAATTLLIPFFFGGVRDFRGDWNFNAVTLAVGLQPWVTLPLALVVAWRATATRALVGIALVSAAIVYGVPLVGPALAALPVIGWGQSLRVAPVLSFAIAALGAVGVDAITRAAPGTRRRAALALAVGVAVLAGVGFVAVVAHPELLARPAGRWGAAQHFLAFLVALTVTALVALRWLRRPEERFRWTVALVALEIATLAPIAVSVNVAANASWLYPEPPVMPSLRTATAADHGRVLIGRQNLGMLYGLSDPTGHDGMTPAHLEAIAGPVGTGRTIGNVGSEPLAASAVFASPAVDVLGVRWFVVPPHAGPPRPESTLRYAAPDARVYDNPRAMPRAFVVPAARCVPEPVSRSLVRGGVDWSREVVLTGECGEAPIAAAGVPPAARERSATFRADTADRVLLDVTTATPAYLVLADAWFPGWTATVDGTEQRVFRAFHAFRAVWVPAGQHAIEFRYRPRSFTTGALLSGLAVTVIVGLLLVSGRRARLATAAAALALVLGPGNAAALAPMPIDLEIAGRAHHLETVRMSITPRPPAREAQTAVDLYVVWAFRPDARFLTADGGWTSEPVPLRRAVRVADLGPFSIDWRADPVGAISIALLAVEPGAHPVDRMGWVWSPQLRWVTVRAPWTIDAHAQRLLVAVGLASVAGVVIVLVYARRA